MSEISLMKQLHDLTATLSGSPASMPPPIALPLYRGSHMAVTTIFQTDKSVTQRHIHIGKHEWIGVIYGKLKVVFEDDHTELFLNQFDTCHVEPGRPHCVMALEDSLSWCVTVPPEDHVPVSQTEEHG